MKHMSKTWTEGLDGEKVCVQSIRPRNITPWACTHPLLLKLAAHQRDPTSPLPAFGPKTKRTDRGNGSLASAAGPSPFLTAEG